MALNRRKFIGKSLYSALFFSGLPAINSIASGSPLQKQQVNKKPIVISTWNHGIPANTEAWKTLSSKGKAVDAVEKGVMIPEADPAIRSVGYGGYPDRDGNVTLDACIMDHRSEVGSVAFLQHIKHPISVARKVMDDTPHVMLVGEGALEFALSKGFKKENLLTDESKKDWENWLKKSEYKPQINIENHDTIGMLAMDSEGDLAGACTTSGAAWKMKGRVGDSPIIGAGLFLDNEVGAAVCTGLGEAVIRTSATTVVVELMRNGASPHEASRQVIERIYKVHKNHSDLPHLQVGIIAVSKSGEVGAFSLRKGFNYAVYDTENGNRLIDSDYILEWED